MAELDEQERWMIVENLMDNLEGLKDLKDDYDVEDIIERNRELLNKLSPNWEEADSCREVETRSLEVLE